MSRWYVLLVLGICCISTSAILVTLSGVHPTVSAFYRNFFAALIWLLLYPFTRPFRAASLKTDSVSLLEAANPCFGFLVRAPRATYLLISLGLFFAVDLWAWHRCIIFLGAGPATLMGNLQVLIVSLLAVFFFRESLQKWFWPGCFLALLGIALLTLTRGIGQAVLPGVFYGLLTALTYSFFLIILRLLRNYQTTPQQILFWVAVITSLFLLLPLLGEGNLLIPGRESLSWLALHAFLSSVVGWWLIITALPHVPVAIASTLLLLQPVLTSIWGHIFLQQFLSSLQIAGIFLAVAGIRLATWRRQ
ncbi:MAG: DMT family transporter [Proteobacteria bacterium]|nr:DMT family transporter [Pseudomonadota bacterium]